MPPRPRRIAASRRPTAGARPTAITKLTENPGHHNWLIHSDPGMGKTVLAGTAPKSLFLTVEAEGTQSAQYAGSAAEQLIINNHHEFVEAQDYFVNGTGCQDYDWVTIDSLSELEDKEVDQILREGNARNKKRSLDKMAIDDYGTRDMRIMRIVDTFNRLPINTLYTAHTMNYESEDDEGNDLIIRQPLLGSTKNGKLSVKISGKVTMVGHLAVVRYEDSTGTTRKVRRLYTEAQPGIMAKNRCGLGEWTDSPTIPKLLAAIGGSEARPARRATRRRSTTR